MNMFDGPDFPLSLDENQFIDWIENGKSNKMGYRYLLIVWDQYDSAYRPVYAQERNEVEQYQLYKSATGRESLVAAYDLYSESRIV